MGTTSQSMKTIVKGIGGGMVSALDGSKTFPGGTIDGGDIKQGRARSENHGGERYYTGFPVLVSTTFSRPDIYRTCPWKFVTKNDQRGF